MFIFQSGEFNLFSLGLFGFDLGLRIGIFDSLLIILPTSLSEQ